MGTFKKFVHKIQLEENLYEIKHAVYDSGSCQCFKDCDCIKNKGELEGYSVKYSNGVVLHPNGKERTYSSIKACKDSLNSYKQKRSF